MALQQMEDWFDQKIGLLCDPYFDREFFTNLIFCIDRKKSKREIFEACVVEFNQTPAFTSELDRSLFHLYAAYQASHYLREGYQWLPLAQGIYTASLYRGDGKDRIRPRHLAPVEARGSNIEDFKKMIHKEARRVIAFDEAWASLIFLLQNRSTRAAAVQVLLQAAIEDYDRLTASFMAKAFDVCFASGWKNAEVFLRRPFERFWERGIEARSSQAIAKAKSLVESVKPTLSNGRGVLWPIEWSEELWFRVSHQSAESAWAWIDELAAKGASHEQVSAALHFMLGRCFYAMRPEQWSIVADALIFAESMQTAARWLVDSQLTYLAALVSDLARVAQLVARDFPGRPTGNSVVEKFSQNLGKNQLVLRLDDAIEKGEEERALDLVHILLKDRGLTHNLSDRLVLMASKQDAWHFSSTSIPVAMFVANVFETAVHLQLPAELGHDAIYGLTRFYLVQRGFSLEQVKKQGHYGDGGLKMSQFDVSGGARVVDRYVFNQLRNAQRIFVWPTEGKG